MADKAFSFSESLKIGFYLVLVITAPHELQRYRGYFHPFSQLQMVLVDVGLRVLISTLLLFETGPRGIE